MWLGLDPMYWLMVAPAMLLALWAQIKVQSTFARMSKVGTRRGITGAQAAERILEQAGIHDVKVEEVPGFLSDHYDPSAKTLRLSPGVFRSSSIAAVGVAAHEAGHAIQHAEGYVAMKVRTFMAPTANIGSMLAVPMIFIGMFLGVLGLVKIGVVLFGALVLFHVVTLPVEFNASTRAKAALVTAGIATGPEEEQGVRQVLSAAAMTYVASTMIAVMQLLYFLLRMSSQSRD